MCTYGGERATKDQEGEKAGPERKKKGSKMSWWAFTELRRPEPARTFFVSSSTSCWSFNLPPSPFLTMKLPCLCEEYMSMVWKWAGYKMLCKCGELIGLLCSGHMRLYPGSHCLGSRLGMEYILFPGTWPRFCWFLLMDSCPEPWKGAPSLFKFALRAKCSFRDLHKINDAFYLFSWLLKSWQRRI